MIKTQRSQWTLLTEKDLLDVHKLQSIPEVERFNTLGLPKDFEHTKEIMMPLIKDNQKGINFTYAIKGLENEFMGLFSVRKFPERYNAVEVWYKYLPEFWG